MTSSSSNTIDSELRLHTICLMSLTSIAIVATLDWLRPLLVPFILSVLLVCGILPVLDFIQQHPGAPRIVAVAVTFLLGVMMLVLVWLIVWMSVSNSSGAGPWC